MTQAEVIETIAGWMDGADRGFDPEKPSDRRELLLLAEKTGIVSYDYGEKSWTMSIGGGERPCAEGGGGLDPLWQAFWRRFEERWPAKGSCQG